MSEKEAIYKAAIQKSDEWNAHNNLAAVYIAMAADRPDMASDYLSQAQAQLEIAANKNPSAEVHSNLATVALWNGNPYKAYDHVEKALAMSPNSDVTQGINGVKGSAEIMMARYDDAIRSLSQATPSKVNLFNKSLAHILNRDFNGTRGVRLEYLENYGDDKDAIHARAAYTWAIAAARVEAGYDDVVDLLKVATDIDPSYKEMALNDLEFREYWETAAMQDAMK
jgi:tetratricopeptide (TPR) repeat protein